MDLGEFVFLARGDLGSFNPPAADLQLQFKVQGKGLKFNLLWRQGQDEPQVLGVVDRQLTNSNSHLPQNHRGVPNPAGQLLSIVAAGLADVKVVSVAANSSCVLAVCVTVRLLPAAFDVVVPEQTSRAAAHLDDDAAAAAAAASVASALLDVVELMHECRNVPRDDLEVNEEDDNTLMDYQQTQDPEPGPSHLGPCIDRVKGSQTSRGAKGVAVTAASAGPGAGSGAVRQSELTGELQAGGTEDGIVDGDHHVYSDVRDEIFHIVAPRDWHLAHSNPSGLKCRLFPYQQRALAWMVWRETQPELEGGREGEPEIEAEAEEQEAAVSTHASEVARKQAAAAAATAAATAHLGDFASQDLFWRRLEIPGGRELWVNPYPGGGLRAEPPPPPRRQRVGILADEMGLGKTVEMIALMLTRPPPPPPPLDPSQRGPQKWEEQAKPGHGGPAAGPRGAAREARPRGPNLIVTPPSILQQWSCEIANHSNLKVYVYDGLRWHRQQSAEKEKERIKAAKQEERLAAQREKEAKRQERFRKLAEKAAAKAARKRAREMRKRAASSELKAQGSGRSRARRRGNGGRRIDSEDSDEDSDVHHEILKGAGLCAEAGARGASAGRQGNWDVHPGVPPSATSNGVPDTSGSDHAAAATGPKLNGTTTATAAAPAARLGQGEGQDAGTRKPYMKRKVKMTKEQIMNGGGPASIAGPSTSDGSAHGAKPNGTEAELGEATAAVNVLVEAQTIPSRMELYHRELMAALYAGTPLCPASCDPTAEAEAAVKELLAADVVLTTYTVLKEEVHYSPSNRVLSGLRHAKKYSVPESPLLQVRWHRLVMDEAQMVGGSYSNVVQMASRIEATHRWCVTGTPIGAGGLHDILGLLCVLKYTPYDDAVVFKHLISDPYHTGTAEGHSRLAALIKPIMWRNSKAVAAQDHPLPRRVLQEAHLRFSAAEQTFYDVILGETRKAYNEMTSYQLLETRQRALQRLEQQQQRVELQEGHQEGDVRTGVACVDLTIDDDDHDGDGDGNPLDPMRSNSIQNSSSAGKSNINNNNSKAIVTSQKGSSGTRKHHGHGKKRRGQDRSETLAQVAGAELHQLRLACVHVQLTRYWQKLGQELALHGHGHGHHGAGGGAGSPPAIDHVMARLRDQAQLHLQNAERDLCMVLNALASRLETTAKKVKAMAVRRALQEMATPAAKQAAVVGDDCPPDEDAATPGIRSSEKRSKKRSKALQAHQDDAAPEPDLDLSMPGGAADFQAGATGGAAGEAENVVSAFRYNASGKSAAALSADAEHMLLECKEFLECSWNVGENGIEAATAAEAAAAAGGCELEMDIKAAAASIRSWRFVQAHTSQLLADLLTAHPQVYASAVSAMTSKSNPGGGGGGTDPSSQASTEEAADAAAATSTAAAVRAAELRSYVASRVTDVRATADRELERARERLDRVNATITRLQTQLVEEYDLAASYGLPSGVIPEPRPWLGDMQARLDAARQVEAERRAEQQEAAAAGATLALMGKEVAALLVSEEATVMRQRVGLEAAAGSLLVAAAVERLRAADRGLRLAHGAGQELVPGPDWQNVLVGGVTMLLPPVGATRGVTDTSLAARAEWCLSYPPALGLLRYAVMDALAEEPVEATARGIAHGFDQMTVLLCERHLRNPIRMLESRLQEQRKIAADRNTAELLRRGLVMLLPALEAVRLRIELLRTWKDHNTAELLLELAKDQCDVVTGEVMAAAQGQVSGMGVLLRMSAEELRSRVAYLKTRCEDLRHKKAFFQNQYLEASRLRHAGSAATAANTKAAAAAAAAGTAQHHKLRSQQWREDQHYRDISTVTDQLYENPVPVAGEKKPVAATLATACTGGGGMEHITDEHGHGAHESSPVCGKMGTSVKPHMGVAAAGNSHMAHVGVACRTGILACLHAWEQWRPPRREAEGPAREQANGSCAVRAEVMDLTGSDKLDRDVLVNDPGLNDIVAMNPVFHEGGCAQDVSINDVVAELGGSVAVASEVARCASEGERSWEATSGGGGNGDRELLRGAPGDEAAAGATQGPEAAPGPLAVEAPVGPAQVDPRAAAAASAARKRMAAAATAARAKLGLDLLPAEGSLEHKSNGKDDGEEGLTCAVCAETLKTDIRLFPCGHYYCASCSDVILGPTGHRRCPTCRMEVRDKDSVVKVGGVSCAVTGAGGAASRLRLLGGEVDPPEGAHMTSVKIEGGSELMCKISALMRRLVWLRDHRPAEKSLVFSQWSDALQIVERGLRSNGIGYVTLETGRKMRGAMSAFLNDDACRVFLLSLRQGAAGLTLVRANHVFLLEPSLDPAIEQQAVARVHRIGQTRDVTVTRLLVDGTVEEAVMRMLKEKQQLFMEVAGSGHSAGAGPSTSGSPRGGGGAGGRGGSGAAGGLVPSAVPLLEGGEGEEASLPTAAPRHEILAGADMSYLLNAVLL